MTTMSLVTHQMVLEQRAFWRNPQAAFFTFALPLALLLGLGATSGDDASLLVPGILAFGIIGASYGNLAATVASLRADGVLKRIRATPLSPHVYLGGHVVSAVGTTSLTGLATLVAGRVAFGVAPQADRLVLLVVAFVLGVTCFASLGLAITALIPTADAAGPITTATYLPLALVSGVFDPSQHLPGWLDAAVSWFPIRALVDTLRAAFEQHGSGPQITDFAVLALWSVIGTVVALRTFRWQP